MRKMFRLERTAPDDEVNTARAYAVSLLTVILSGMGLTMAGFLTLLVCVE